MAGLTPCVVLAALLLFRCGAAQGSVAGEAAIRTKHYRPRPCNCSMTYDRASELLKLWDGHIATGYIVYDLSYRPGVNHLSSFKPAEFTEKTADAAVATMVPDATVNHVPVITGGQGTDKLRDFYRDHFISKMPSDVSLVPIERTVGKNAQGVEIVVDEFIFQFTHNIKMDWMLPGVKPTGKKVKVPFIVVVKFDGNKLKAESIYWDQATVL